jgi:hypothetical protein
VWLSGSDSSRYSFEKSAAVVMNVVEIINRRCQVMDEFGIEEDTSVSSALSESIALKAFLRLKRDERKRQSSSITSTVITPKIQEKTREYSVSYNMDDGNYFESSRNDSSNPAIFPEDSEEKKNSIFMEDRRQNSSFSSMHALINSTFQEKIDYQRKLREQLSELNAAKDRLLQLRTENSRLTAATIKLKQKHLPIALRHVSKMRRRSLVLL